MKSGAILITAAAVLGVGIAAFVLLRQQRATVIPTYHSGGCNEGNSIPVLTVLRDPQQYQGTTFCIAGYYFTGFETNKIVPEVHDTGSKLIPSALPEGLDEMWGRVSLNGVTPLCRPPHGEGLCVARILVRGTFSHDDIVSEQCKKFACSGLGANNFIENSSP